MLAKNSPQLSAVVPIKAETFTNSVIFVTLTKFADSTTGKYFVFRCLEVRLDDQSTIVDESVFVNDVENLSINIDES